MQICTRTIFTTYKLPKQKIIPYLPNDGKLTYIANFPFSAVKNMTNDDNGIDISINRKKKTFFFFKGKQKCSTRFFMRVHFWRRGKKRNLTRVTYYCMWYFKKIRIKCVEGRNIICQNEIKLCIRITFNKAVTRQTRCVFFFESAKIWEPNFLF